MEQNKEQVKEQVKEQCKVCGKEYKSVNIMHVRTHDIDMEQYELLPEYAQISTTVEPKGNIKFTQTEMQTRIFGEQEKDINRPLSDFLNEFGVTEKEARELLKKFTTGKRIDPRIQATNFQKIGTEGAEALKDQDEVETTSLHVAEALTTKYGFTCTDLRGRRGDTPKTWFLKKVT